MSKSDNWDDYANTWTPRKTKWVIVLAILVCLVLPAIGFGLKVAFSPVQGRGDQIVKNNSEVNRTGKQEMFEDLYAHINAYKVQIGTAEGAAKANTDPTDQGRLNAIVSGLKNQCVSVTEQYNAESHKVLAQDWKDDRLPYELSPAACAGSSK